MSYEDMARSYIQDLARNAFGLTEVEVDEDGDLPSRFGTAQVYVAVAGSGRYLRVWSCAVRGIRVGKAVLRELNEANAHLVLARVYGTADAVWVEGHLPMESAVGADLRTLHAEVGVTADRLGTMLAAVHGGEVAFPPAVACDCCESED